MCYDPASGTFSTVYDGYIIESYCFYDGQLFALAVTKYADKPSGYTYAFGRIVNGAFNAKRSEKPNSQVPNVVPYGRNGKNYFKKAGQKIVDLHDKALDMGVNAAVKVDIPAAWADAQDAPAAEISATPFVRDIVLPMDRQQGVKLPVSVFLKHGVLDGTWENGTSAYSKRGVATAVP